MSISSSLQPARSILRQSSCSTFFLSIRSAPPSAPASVTRTSPFSRTSIRHATHGAQGRANGPKNGPGKRLGAKKTADEYVIPGNIIFRQRGSNWYPGDNVGMGRDHTIYALQEGYVRYYRDPHRHPDKKYIGIVFDRKQSLPAPLNAVRRRKLSMVAVPRKDLVDSEGDAWASAHAQSGGVGIVPNPAEPTGKTMSVLQAASHRFRPTPTQLKEIKRLTGSGRVPVEQLKMRADYSYRESNYEIGRAAERAGVSAPRYKPGDRFLAWRKRTLRQKANAEKRAIGRKKGSDRKGKKN